MSNEDGEQDSPVKGNLIVVSAPSGAGKSSLVQKVLGRIEGLRYSISWTTRPARGAEQQEIDYFFVSPEEFEAMREQDGFLEHAVVHGYLYGTPIRWVRKVLSRGEDVVLDIDVQGARQIRSRMPEAVTVFVLPPNRAELEARLRSRNQNNEDDLQRRLSNSRSEVLEFQDFRYMIVNEDLERASSALEAIIIAERHRSQRLQETARRIVDTFGGESAHA